MNRKPAFALIIVILIALLALTACGQDPSVKGGTIRGIVMLEDGGPGFDTLVSATDKTNTYYIRAGADGSYQIEGMAPSTYSVTFIKTGYANKTVEDVVVTKDKGADLGTVTLMCKTGTISGKVTDEDGKPLSGANVTFFGSGNEYSVKSDATGKYSVTVRTSKYTDLEIAYPDHNLKCAIDVTVKADTETKMPDYKVPYNHNYVLVEMVEPTYEKSGYRKYKCTDCQDIHTDVIPAIDLAKWAGVRVSSYGMTDSFGSFPGVTEMTGFAGKMESCYEGSIGTYIFIVGTVDELTWACHLGFPLSKQIDMVYGTSEDLYEAYLDAFDEAGYSVWLQVEPGNADLVDLATEVMSHYGHHSCVKGFGIDVEWYKPEGTRGYGTELDKTTARKVLAAARKINDKYTVFVKHWVGKYLTEGEPIEGFIYVNDSQGFRKRGDKTPLERMCEEFANWADNFYPRPVMFQIGYESDEQNIWGSMENPAKELGTAIVEASYTKNDIGIIWVDFTLKEVIEKIPTE